MIITECGTNYRKLYRMEVPITDHLRDYASYLEKYKAVQRFSHVGRQKSGGLPKILGILHMCIIEAKSWPKHITIV